jgi:uncharacterized protein (UPF0332 family)
MTDSGSLKKQGRIQSVSIDTAKAEGSLKRSKRRFDIQVEKKITGKNAFEVLEGVYEAIRESIEAGMSADGFKSEDHVGTIAYVEEKLGLKDSEVNKLHRFRKLRNKSRYEAKEVKKQEAEQILEFRQNLVPEIRKKVREKIGD